MKYLISTILVLFFTIHAFSQAGIYEKESDFKSGKVKEMGKLERYNNGKLFFSKDGEDEETKVKKSQYYGFRDNDGYDYRIIDNDNIYKLHVKGNICIWGFGLESTLEKEEQYYAIESSGIFISKTPTTKLVPLSSNHLSGIGKLLRSDSKLYKIYKRISKKTFRRHYNLLFYTIFLYNERKPLKNGFIK